MLRTARRLLTAACESVVTAIPAAAWVAHAGSSLGYQQSVGTSMPALRAASRIVAPGSTVTGRASIVSVMAVSDIPRPSVRKRPAGWRDRRGPTLARAPETGLLNLHRRAAGHQTPSIAADACRRSQCEFNLRIAMHFGATYIRAVHIMNVDARTLTRHSGLAHTA